jgi:hypothetical protein
MSFDISGYKTTPCKQHPPNRPPSDPWMLSCPHFHSPSDHRRSPSQHSYLPIYLYSDPSLCLNVIEYLFHPAVYKTRLCAERGCRFRGELGCCPFVHWGEGVLGMEGGYDKEGVVGMEGEVQD